MQKWILAAAFAASLATTVPAWAIGETPAERAAIREMELLQRPNRVGHFYGNNVRRVHRYFNARANQGSIPGTLMNRTIESVDWRLTR